MIRHEPIKLRNKRKWANTTTRPEAEAARMDVDEDEFEEEEVEDSSEGIPLHLLSHLGLRSSRPR